MAWQPSQGANICTLSLIQLYPVGRQVVSIAVDDCYSLLCTFKLPNRLYYPALWSIGYDAVNFYLSGLV